MAPLAAKTLSVILNVDDNDGARHAKTRTLLRAGFDVLEAGTGLDALDLARKNLPDLVLLDIKLPGISGLEVCRRIKQDPATSTILVLQTSASLIDSSDRVRGLEEGADNYLAGPVEPLELIANVNALLRLRDAQRALRDAAVRKDEFLATLAHELRNPLAPMRTAIDLMRMLDTGKMKVDKANADAREMISRQIDHMVRLVDDLLDVSRITQGKLSLKKSFIEVQRIIEAAIETNEAFMRDRQHTLNVKMPQQKLWINGDSVRLAQVVSNLLHNAAKYTPPGGVIELNVAALDERLRIIVSDNGIGIRRENIDQIFELFTQAQRLDSKAPEGLGVGLSLVRSLVELHGGTIAVHSPGIGGGSAFTIELPLNPKLPIATRRVPQPLKGTTKNPLRILLVDDSVDAVNMMRLLLERLGHSVAVANDSRAALALASALVPHVVLLDIGLPGVDGYEVAREMVKMPELQKTKLVALTGYGQDKDRELAFASGFSHHFIKPVEIVDLNNFLSSIEAF